MNVTNVNVSKPNQLDQSSLLNGGVETITKKAQDKKLDPSKESFSSILEGLGSKKGKQSIERLIKKLFKRMTRVVEGWLNSKQPVTSNPASSTSGASPSTTAATSPSSVNAAGTANQASTNQTSISQASINQTTTATPAEVPGQNSQSSTVTGLFQTLIQGMVTAYNNTLQFFQAANPLATAAAGTSGSGIGGSAAAGGGILANLAELFNFKGTESSQSTAVDKVSEQGSSVGILSQLYNGGVEFLKGNWQELASGLLSLFTKGKAGKIGDLVKKALPRISQFFGQSYAGVKDLIGKGVSYLTGLFK